MIQRTYGTKRPMNEAGGVMRRSVVLLASLLLVCVLMAGAVSAEEWHEVTTYAELKSNLSDGNYTKLTQDISATASDKRINITGVSTTLDLNGRNLSMTMGTSAFSIGNDTATPQNTANLTVLDSSNGKTGNITSTDNYLFFVKNASTVHLQSGTFKANYSVIAGNGNGEWGSPTFTVDSGVNLISTGGVAVFLPANGTNATITGATITGVKGGISIAAGNVTIKDTTISVTGNEKDLSEWDTGPCEDLSAISVHKLSSSYPGDLNLKLEGTTSLTSTNGAALTSYIDSKITNSGEVTVVIGDQVNINGKSVVSAAHKYSNIDIVGNSGAFQDTQGNKLLYPGLNQTGVAWTGNEANGYTLTLSASGNYKLMKDFTATANIKISSDNTVFDGNGKKITSTSVPGAGTGVFCVQANSTTVKNLNLDASQSSASGTGIMQTIVIGTGNPDKPASTWKDITLYNNTIWAGTSQNHRSSAILVGADNVTLKENTLHLGSSTRTDASAKVRNESIGIRSYGGPEDMKIIGNTITKNETSTHPQVGVLLDEAPNTDPAANATITGNTFDLGTNGYVISHVNRTIADTANIVFTGNTVNSAKHWLYAGLDDESKPYSVTLNLAGRVTGNTLTGVAGKMLFNTTSVALTNALTWNSNTEPAAKTLTIQGNTSIENVSTKTETLTAKSGNENVLADWSITGEQNIIAFTTSTSGVSSVTYKPLKIGTTNITVIPATGAAKTIIITVYNTTAPAIDTEVTTEGGKVNVSVPTNGKSTIEVPSGATTTTTTATIKDESSGVDVVLTYAEGATFEKTGSTVTSVNGTIAEMVAAYPESDAPVSADMPVAAKYVLNITLDASKALKDGAAIILPIIDPAVNQTVVTTITQKNSNHKPLAMITAVAPSGSTLTAINNNISGTGIALKFIIPKEGKYATALGKVKALHISGDTIQEATFQVQSESTEWIITVYGTGFSAYALVEDTTVAPYVPSVNPPVSSGSGDGNMDGAYRVLFETQGGSSVTPATGLSAGDKITAPANPVRDGYTFGGWYKDAACTQAWSFSDGIPGDMSLYAKWTGGSSGAQGSSGSPSSSTQPTAKQTTAPVQTQSQSGASATTAAPVTTTAAGSSSPAMTQAPAPVFGALLGLLAAGVLLRRRE